MLKDFETVRTTVTIPADLIERTQNFVDSGLAPSRNALFVAALEHFLLALERQEIDRQFTAMAEDAAYLTLNEEVAESFAASDWDSLAEAEGK